MSAKDTVFNVIKFTFLINIAVGFIFTLFPAMASLGTGFEYTENDSSYFTDEMQKQINPDGLLEDKTDATSRVFDMLNLGLLKKISTVIKHYLYGIVVIFDMIIGGFLDPKIYSYLFSFPLGAFYTMMNLAYIFAIWSLLTGQDE